MDAQTFSGLVEWITAYPEWAGLIIFLIALVESLLIVGIIIPGVVMMFAVGALIGTGVLSFWPSLLLAFMGATVGDGISFWIGKRFQDDIAHWWPFSRKPELLQQSKKFFNRHGGKSVLFGRFVGPLRAVIPAVAGMMGMNSFSFFVVNIFSALLWAPAYLLPGMIFGSSLELASEVATRLVVFVVLLGSIFVFVFWAVNRLNRYLAPRLEDLAVAVATWGDRHPVFGPPMRVFIDPVQPELRALSQIILAIFVFIWLIGLALLEFSRVDGLFLHEKTLINFLAELHTPFVDAIAHSFAGLLAPVSLITVTILVASLFLLSRNILALSHWIAGILACYLLAHMLDLFLINTPPTEGASIPVWTPVVASLAYGFPAILWASQIRAQKRWLVYSAITMFIFLVGFIPLYLSLIPPIESVLLILLGVLILIAISLAYRRREPNLQTSRFAIPVLLLCVLATNFFLTGNRSYESFDLIDQHIDLGKEKVVLNDWWNTGWDQLPSFRQDMRGSQSQAFVMQWLGSIEDLEAHLKHLAWTHPPAADSKSLLSWLTPNNTLESMWVLPHVHEGRHQDFIMRKLELDADNQSQKQLVLRMWRSVYVADQNEESLWLATLTVQRIESVLGLIQFPKTLPEYVDLKELLGPDALPGFERKKIVFETERASSRPEGKDLLLLRKAKK